MARLAGLAADAVFCLVLTVVRAYPIYPFESQTQHRLPDVVGEHKQGQHLYPIAPTNPLLPSSLRSSSSSSSLDSGATPNSSPSQSFSSSLPWRQTPFLEMERTSRRESMPSKALGLLNILDFLGPTNASSSSAGGTESRIPPPFMINLYNSVADADSGRMFGRSPFNANTVRALSDRARKHRLWFKFDVSRVESTEVLLQAELHLFRLKPRWKTMTGRRPSFFQVHVYQLMSKDPSSLEGARLIGLRLMSARGTGWEVFSIRDAVQDWLANSTSNHGIYITVTSLSGQPFPNTLLRFVKRGRQDDSRQPILVLFSEDSRFAKSPEIASAQEGPTQHEPRKNLARYKLDEEAPTTGDPRHPSLSTIQYHLAPSDKVILRRKRALEQHEVRVSPTPRTAHSAMTTQKKSQCSRADMHVDMDAIGWSNRVIMPVRYNAYRCTGRCPFPLPEGYPVTNHAVIQSIMNMVDGDDIATPPPCCVPATLHPISFLYFDDEENAVLKTIEDMIVGTCGCS
ncbi:bone morphogenetic protein 2-like [Diadema antillarum]|uniref:bone morphogenetic protein 2-like n=1 Tax=Diadema antillarum TaxID=105358 RepID=UPI003A86740A